MKRVAISIVGLCILFLFAKQASAADPDCQYVYWYDDQRSSCLSCSRGGPPWGTTSFYAHRKVWYVLCQACNVPCQVQTNIQTNESERVCPAVSSDGAHLKDALLYGIESPASAKSYAELEREAPELALVLLSQGLSNGKASQIDMRYNESFSSRLPSSRFVGLIRSGKDISNEDVERYTQALPSNHGLRIEARTELGEAGVAALVLSSSIIELSSKKLVRPMNEYAVYLSESGKRAKVLQYDRAPEAKVLQIASIKKVN